MWESILSFALNNLNKIWAIILPYFKSPIKVELPTPVNPMGRTSALNMPSWNVKVRFIGQYNQPRDIFDFRLIEEGVGQWSIDEIFDEHNGMKVHIPIHVPPTQEVWLRAHSNKTFLKLPFEVGPLTLQYRDNTQAQGTFHSFQMTHGPTHIDR